MKIKTLLLAFLLGASLMVTEGFAKTGAEIAKELEINAGSKAIRQWERIFKKRSRWKRFGIDKLSDAERDLLKEYLLSHAADSDRPAAAGIY